MSEINSLTDTPVHVALRKIVTASRNQPGNQEEILKLLKQIPVLSTSILPISDNAQPTSPPDSDVLELFQSISKHLINGLKQEVQLNDVDANRPKRICIFLENLSLLGGCDYAKAKFQEIVSHATYLLIQENMEFVEDLVEHLPRVATSLVSLIKNVKPFVMDICDTLFLCEALNMTFGEQMKFVSNEILEKLSTELLTIVDALKEFAINNSSGKITSFLEVEPNSCEDSITITNMLSLASILDHFNELEMDLHCSISSKVQKLKNSSDKFRKSSLKHRLPDILRSSQEGSWTRSITVFGEWDWQEILRDIAPAIVNSVTESFENFHAKEMSTLKNIHCDEPYQINTASSLTHDWLPETCAPKKTISQFKEVTSLIKSTLPFGVIGSHYKPLSSLLSCYIDECCQILKIMKPYLSMLLDDFPEKVTLSTLLCAVAACEDVVLALQFCSMNINTDVRAPFQGVCQSYSDMCKMLKSAIIQYLCTRVRLNILHDGESNHFSDPKEFADGDRCSFAIENWKRFLGRMWGEMELTVSESSKNHIFSVVFLDSLNVLKLRYLRCQPTFNRSKQLHSDICNIISTCEEYLSKSNSPALSDTPLFSECDCCKISSACQVLFAVMTLINVPLNELRNSLSNMTFEAKNGRNYDAKSVVSQFLKSVRNGDDSLVQCLVALFSGDRSFLHFVLSNGFKEQLGNANAQYFRRNMYNVLASDCSLLCEEFFNCAISSVHNDRQALINNCVPHAANSTYSWQSVFTEKLDRVLCKSLAAPVSFLCQPCWSSFMKNIISSLPASVKESVSDMGMNSEDTENRLTASVILILAGLKNALYLLPEWIVKFLAKLRSYNQSDEDNNTSIHIILKETQRILTNPDIWEEHCQLDLTKDGVDAMRRASSFLSRICDDHYRPVSEAENVALNALTSVIKEAHECFRLLPEIDFKYSEKQLLQVCRLEVADMKIDGGNSYDSLKAVCATLKEHSDWLKMSWMRDHGKEIPALQSILNEQDWNEKCHHVFDSIDWKTIRIIFSHRWETRTGAAITDAQANDLDMIWTIVQRNVESSHW